ncbi:hypothetical protein [Aurantibacter sp.]|uniref:hypothetical protein n=1 Tax=Aurantibacter sp. TaxID=2807103 RepID=UPI0035C83FCD
MKKNFYISNLLIVLLTISCGQNSSEKELNGNWREVENEYSTWHFYPDSIVFKSSGTTLEKTDWNANKSQIKLEIPTFDRNSAGNLIDTINKVQIDYKLSKKKDSLFGTLKNNYCVHEFSILKTKNYNEYLNRKFGIELTLPKRDTIGLKNIDTFYGMKIFMTSENDELIKKTEFSASLNNLENDIKRFKDKLVTHFGPKDFRNERFYLSVYADKKISDSIITVNLDVTFKSDFFLDNEIPRPPGDTIPIRVYRMYSNTENNNLNFRKAKNIKSIANIIYN